MNSLMILEAEILTEGVNRVSSCEHLAQSWLNPNLCWLLEILDGPS